MKVVDIAKLLNIEIEQVKEMLNRQDIIQLNLTEKNRKSQPDDMKIMDIK